MLVHHIVLSAATVYKLFELKCCATISGKS